MLAQLIDHPLGGGADGAHRDDQGVGIFGAIRHHDIGEAATKSAFEFVLDAGVNLDGAVHGREVLVTVHFGLMRQVDLPQCVRRFAEPMRHRGERQEAVGLYLIGNVDLGDGMREDEAFHADHDRHHHRRILGEAKSGQHGIEQLLIVGAVDLDQALVAQHQRVAVVGPDVPGRPHGAVGHGHHHRQA